MSLLLQGCGAKFDLFFDEEPNSGLGLPPEFQEIYGSDWRLPADTTKPYLFSNFAISHDGRISYNLDGYYTGGCVTSFDTRDRWIMGLLRARADAVMVGDRTLELEPRDHLWTPGYICPQDKEAFASLRFLEKRPPTALHCFLSLEGRIHWESDVFSMPEIPIVIATTRHGGDRIRREKPAGASVHLLDHWSDKVVISELVAVLHREHNVRTILCEGGSSVYGNVLAEGILDEEFLTMCPRVIGNCVRNAWRPGLVESTAFDPDSSPQMVPISLRRAGAYLYLRSKYTRR